MDEQTKVAIVGLGTVGTGVAQLAPGPRRSHGAARGTDAVAGSRRRPRRERAPPGRSARRHC